MDADVSSVVNKHVGVASLDTLRTQFVVSNCAGNALVASVHTSLALRVAGFALSINSQIVCGAGVDTHSFHCVCSVVTSSTIAWVLVAGLASGVAVLTGVSGGFVETVGALEGADSSDHHVGTFVIAST